MKGTFPLPIQRLLLGDRVTRVNTERRPGTGRQRFRALQYHRAESSIEPVAHADARQASASTHQENVIWRACRGLVNRERRGYNHRGYPQPRQSHESQDHGDRPHQTDSSRRPVRCPEEADGSEEDPDGAGNADDNHADHARNKPSDDAECRDCESDNGKGRDRTRRSVGSGHEFEPSRMSDCRKGRRRS